ncbi:hypothetical protein LPJ59_006704, partial [Coemansia sp. RSA 2399]
MDKEQLDQRLHNMVQQAYFELCGTEDHSLAHDGTCAAVLGTLAVGSRFGNTVAASTARQWPSYRHAEATIEAGIERMFQSACKRQQPVEFANDHQSAAADVIRKVCRKKQQPPMSANHANPRKRALEDPTTFRVRGESVSDDAQSPKTAASSYPGNDDDDE